jgi:hypothetical protein
MVIDNAINPVRFQIQIQTEFADPACFRIVWVVMQEDHNVQ